MLRAWAVWLIFQKEMLETLRDRRTLVLMVVLPVLLYPALIAGMAGLTSAQVEKLRAEEAAVAVDAGVPGALRERLAASRMRIRPAIAEPDLRAALLRREALVAVLAAPGCAEELAREGSCGLTLYFDETNDRSLAAVGKVSEAVRLWQEAEVARRAQARGLPAAFPRPARVEQRSVSTAAERVGNLAGRILPVLLISLMLAGAFYPAVDMAAGEKERGTMQTLLCAPVTPLEIVSGKFLAVVVLAMASGAINLTALGLATIAGVQSLAQSVPGGLAGPVLVAVGPLAYAVIFLLVTPLALLFSALALAVAAFAKSYREAQSYLTPVYLLAVLPAMVTSLPGIELEGGLVFVPVLNLALLLREILVGRGGSAVLPVLAINMACAAAALIFAARVYATQEALIGSGKAALAAVLRRRR